MARLGTLAIVAGTVLSAPFAIGTASAAPLAASDVSTTNGNITSVAEATNHVVYSAGTMGTINLTLPGNPAIHDQVTISLSASGAPYFVTGQPGVTSPTSVTCTWNAAPAAGEAPQCAASYNVGDDTAETVQVIVSDATNASSTVTSLGFNAITIDNCTKVGYETATALAAPQSTAVNCVTQAQFNTPLTETAHYQTGSTAGAGQQLSVTLSGNQLAAGSQPADGGCTSTFPFQVLTCTTNAAGDIKFTVNNSGTGNPPAAEADTITVATLGATGAYPVLMAAPPAPTQQVNWAVGGVTPTRVDVTAGQVIAPSTQGTATAPFAQPGDVVQGTFKVMGSCTVAAGNATCDNGTPLANATVTVTVDHGFITPNCTKGGITSYAECSFTTTPTVGGAVGNLTNSGQSASFTTNASGNFTASFGIGRDTAFDANGRVPMHVTVAGLPTLLPGDHTTAQTCPTGLNVLPTIPGGGAPSVQNGPFPGFGGCQVDGAWTTNEQPLNGKSAAIKVVPALSSPNNVAILTENNDDAATGTTAVNVPDVDRVVFKVVLTDQFDNVTSNLGATGKNIAQLFKTGPGKLWNCGAAFNTTDACSATGNGGRFTNAQQSDGTFNEAFAAVGSYTNVGAQNRYQVDTAQNGAGAGNAGFGSETPSVNDGTTTTVLSWTPPTTTFATYIAGTPVIATFAAGNGTAVTDTLTLNFYNQLAQPVVTFSVSPGNSVQTSTAVTVTATTVDQHGNPIVSIPGVTTTAVQVVRSGANEKSCTPIQNAANQILGSNTSGVTGYTFSCDAAGVANVSMVITGPGGVQLAQGREAITFTGSSIGGGLKTEKPKLGITAPKRHVLVLHVTTHPSLGHVKVHFYKVRHGLKLLVGADRTGPAGHAHLRIKHLKSGTHPKYTAKVVGLSDKYKSKYAKAKRHRVR